MPVYLECPDLIYCPYTDREISKAQSSSEHIIPLSLGGTNELTIDVDKESNSQVGHELDGALANDFLVALRRSEYGARGHSGKEPWAIFKNASHGDELRPAQVHLHRRHGLRLWDAKENELTLGSGNIQFITQLDVHLPIRFTAKAALAAGYYVYRDHFRHNVDHHQLREIMQTNLTHIDQEKVEERVDGDRDAVLADDYLNELASQAHWQLRCIRTFCDGIRGSVVVLIPHKERLVVSVGILGKYLALLNVPANTETFPNEGDFEWGHVLAVVDNRLLRCSWREGLRQLESRLGKTKL